MSGIEALQSVQYVIVKNKRYAVVEMEEWEALLEWLETIEDLQIFRQSEAELAAADGDPEKPVGYDGMTLRMSWHEGLSNLCYPLFYPYSHCMQASTV